MGRGRGLLPRHPPARPRHARRPRRQHRDAAVRVLAPADGAAGQLAADLRAAAADRAGVPRQLRRARRHQLELGGRGGGEQRPGVEKHVHD